ncbi:MAG TPA: tetratricopeptide repeat protein [Candidatus Acidoferrum sp.]
MRTLVVFALAPGARSQAPAQAQPEAPLQTPTRVTAPPADDDFSALLGRATAGDAQAQYALGSYYFRGRSLPLEHAEALGWYRKSAEQGYAPAENQLGAMYQHGFGVVRNFKLALAYYRKAADQGDAPAKVNLGVTYESGNYAVKRDYKRAFAWYQKAADQNWPDGEREVGYFYQCGFAVKQDLTQALAGYRRSAGHGNAMAENQLGYFAEEGWGEPKRIRAKLSPGTTKPQSMATTPPRKTSGTLFQDGVGVATDYAKALYWFHNAAADQGNVHGKNNLQAFCDELEDRGEEVCEPSSEQSTMQS